LTLFLETAVSGLVFLTDMLWSNLSRVISPVSWSMMSTHSLRWGFLDPLYLVFVCSDPSTLATETVTLFPSPNWIAASLEVSTERGLKSSVQSD
jgi:hypothetical protein